MKKYCLIDNIYFKFFLYFIIINLILEKEFNKNEVNDLKDYFSQTICQLIFLNLYFNCSISFFKNTNFYNDILEINNNINLLINIKKPKLENILILLGIIPFLKNNSTLSYKINNKGIYKVFKTILKKKIKNNIIKFDYNDLLSFNKKLKKLLYYKWELIPNQFLFENIRYIINNYYDEQNLVVLEKSLNMNYKLYIQNKKFEMTNEEIKILLSKIIIINFIYKENIGIYEKQKCVGRGSTGRVCILF